MTECVDDVVVVVCPRKKTDPRPFLPVIAVNPSMRSTTNLLIINLAIADILFVLFCVPYTASDYALPMWPFGNLWCKIVSEWEEMFVTRYK